MTLDEYIVSIQNRNPNLLSTETTTTLKGDRLKALIEQSFNIGYNSAIEDVKSRKDLPDFSDIFRNL